MSIFELQKESPNEEVAIWSKHLENMQKRSPFYRAVAQGLGVELQAREEREVNLKK